VALGCEARHAERLVYAEALDLARPARIDPIGITCRACPRSACSHRAYPAAHQDVPRTDYIRTDPLFAGG
jgi:predicted transcriptional regulator